MQTEHFFQLMKDGTEVAVNRWLPEDDQDIKAIVVLCHGMLEHSLRYDRVGYLFVENGFALNAHDHRGHGKTANNAVQKGCGAFGKIADSDGFSKVVSDLDEIIDEVRKDFPGKKVILLGHSFGSIVAQNYIENHGNKVDACILCGTTGPKSIAKAGLFLCNLLCLFGKNRRSAFLQNKVAFRGYLSKIKNPSSANAWISKNEDNVQMYENDSWCGGTATVSFIRDITAGLCKTHRDKAMKKIPKDLPVYFIAGTEDPVGDYNKSIKKLISIYKSNGMKNIQECFIEGERHEVFNEKDGDENVLKVINWIDSVI